MSEVLSIPHGCLINSQVGFSNILHKDDVLAVCISFLHYLHNYLTLGRSLGEGVMRLPQARHQNKATGFFYELCTSGVALVCPEVFCQKRSVRESVATEGTLVGAVSLPVDPCLMPFQGLLATEPSPT
ncbi:hypothetical protein E2C01_025882 [Portunus trituberculatus]|uniref:Uncharacterized protein n=1 Tax=Portunus trituberculatus TaxID=210409 RepID=A0A5B7EHB9_PORTR|nr:hypothetical protein [Portunus trituberculatus]